MRNNHLFYLQQLLETSEGDANGVESGLDDEGVFGLDRRSTNRIFQQLRAEVDKSAEVVAAGRRELDGVRQWMLDAASEVPRTAEGERMLYPVVSRGSGEIVEILERAVADMHSISTRIGGIGAEYHALSGDLELGTGDGGGQAQIPLPSADKPMNTRG